MEDSSIEKLVFEFIDQCKLLFFPEQWNSTFLDYSKNEIFALLYVYRNRSANMTQIADYLKVPLNTATGIISRLEKRSVISRDRDVVDKRVVTIVLTEEGREFFAQQIKELEHYYKLFMDNVTEDERIVLFRLIGKFLEIMTRDSAQKDQVQDAKKTIRKIIIE